MTKAIEAFRITTTRDPSGTVDLRYGLLPAKTKAKRFVVFLNGRTEWIEKYAYLPFDLGLPDDCAFLTMDHRGQGASGGARAYVDRYETYANDAGQVVREVVGELPYAVMAHSMGGLISLYGTLHGQLQPSTLALCSPLLGLPKKPLPQWFADPVSRLLTTCKLGAVSTGAGSFTRTPFERNRLTHDYDLYKRMCDTPYPVPAATFGWVSASYAAIAACFQKDALARLRCPTLVLGGSAEEIVDPAAFRLFAERAAAATDAPVKLRVIPGARHELLSEIPKYYEQALEAVRGHFREFLS